jgi:flagellar basal-body rod protein FlgF
MDHMIYVAMTGAREALRLQGVSGHNIANASTTGFREIRHAMGSEPITGPGLDSRVNAVPRRDVWNANPGTMVQTGRDLDIAIQGEGWIAVQDPSGSEGFTRAGELRVNASGLLETAAGKLVKGSGGPISIPPNNEIYIGADGQISIVPQGQGAEALVVVDRIKLVNPPRTDLIQSGDGLFRLADGSDGIPDATVQIASGQLETSNVNTASMLVEMIELSRAYEMQVRVMHTADENAAAAARLIQPGG